MTPEQLAHIEALCREHQRMDCPGVVLSVAQVESLVSAYRNLKQIQHIVTQAKYDLLDHDLELCRNHLSVILKLTEEV